MDDQNEGLKERWAPPTHVPERGYAETEPPVEQRTAEIRSDIEQTRADMTETIDAIQEKLRPGSIVSSATDTVRNATVGRMKDMASSARDTFRGDAAAHYSRNYGVVERIRANPIPAALATASLAWIAFRGRPSRRLGPAIYSPTGGENATSTARSRVQQFLRDNPLAAGALAAAVGASVGMALPETRRENEVMGDARDAIVDRAQEAARNAAVRVQDAARSVEEVAAEAASKVTSDE